MKVCVVFSGLNSLDLQEVRFNAVRIPEVIKRIHQAQKIWDELDKVGFDLANYLASEDRVFLNNIKLKSLASAIVQMGLYDRYLRNHSEPNFFIGDSTGDAPLTVAVGKSSFADLIRESRALKLTRPNSPVQIADELQLSGMSLTQYGALHGIQEQGVTTFHDIDVDSNDIHKIVLRMIEEFDVRRFINVGPGNLLIDSRHPDLEMTDIQILESIDLDPMLSWFWARPRQAV